MTDILSGIGTEPCAFATADDALTYLLEAHCHCPLVVVDQGLPGQIQGVEFIAMVKGKWPGVASILTSGYVIEDAMIPSSTIYLHKPWALDDLVLAVATLLQPGYPLQKT
ncbi:response regulator [Pseudomonas prosekii]|uniref:response regulator n=1 Tax=Pseudomonas prosekii TaxID=1148509 RepID=UPI003F752921